MRQNEKFFQLNKSTRLIYHRFVLQEMVKDIFVREFFSGLKKYDLPKEMKRPDW